MARTVLRKIRLQRLVILSEEIVRVSTPRPTPLASDMEETPRHWIYETIAHNVVRRETKQS